MFSQSAYTAWLDTRAGQVFEKITHQETLTQDEVLLLILKSQSDQLRELVETMNARFEQVDKRFEQVDKRFEQLSNNFKWGIIVAIGFLSLLMTALRFLGPS